MPTDADSTLPSVNSAHANKYGTQELVLTIVFHPDTSRIGQRAVVPQQSGNAPWVLGRRSPDFQGGDSAKPLPLHDPYVSRRALQFTLRGKRLVINRFEASSRCRFDGEELYESIDVEWERLSVGIPILLGHSVVLLLKLVRPYTVQIADDEVRNMLRGSSVAMADIRDQIARAGDSDLDVLIRGETGTGKELAARAIHQTSRRAHLPMVSVNMAAIPVDLAASVLFGNARGAFTGANDSAKGYFEQAEGGSVFLDEIGDAALEVQPQLLRVLQQREIQAVGGPIRRVDVRVISATDAELDGQGGDFKAALRHRLGAYEIVIPPLRDHAEDIGELLMYFLGQSAAEADCSELLPNGQTAAPDIAAWALLFLRFVSYGWPGNVRELANFAQQVVLASERTPVMNDALCAALVPPGKQSSVFSSRQAPRKMQDIADDVFDKAMVDNNFELVRVAQQLGVSRTAIYRRIEASDRYCLASEVPLDELQQLMSKNNGDCVAVAQHLRVSLTGLRNQLRKLASV
jgi:two-component system nitrogen regulation response regulator GlnG